MRTAGGGTPPQESHLKVRQAPFGADRPDQLPKTGEVAVGARPGGQQFALPEFRTQPPTGVRRLARTPLALESGVEVVQLGFEFAHAAKTGLSAGCGGAARIVQRLKFGGGRHRRARLGLEAAQELQRAGERAVQTGRHGGPGLEEAPNDGGDGGDDRRPHDHRNDQGQQQPLPAGQDTFRTHLGRSLHSDV